MHGGALESMAWPFFKGSYAHCKLAKAQANKVQPEYLLPPPNFFGRLCHMDMDAFHGDVAFIVVTVIIVILMVTQMNTVLSFKAACTVACLTKREKPHPVALCTVACLTKREKPHPAIIWQAWAEVCCGH
eukprot:EG_transcript_2276